LEERLSPAELKFLEQQLSSSFKDAGKQFVPVSDAVGEDTTLIARYSSWKITVLYFSNKIRCVKITSFFELSGNMKKGSYLAAPCSLPIKHISY
jgi:hypothetical protein